MTLNNCYFERITNASIGVLLFLFSLGFSAITIAFLPVIGFLVALPVLGLSIYFLRAQRSKECSL